jgi:O-antigen/teichoic acid export membrane protein|tara:strand:- start:475 stop:1677 length:1203 start_codon:yes stop_codon:yes gene_type:complete
MLIINKFLQLFNKHFSLLILSLASFSFFIINIFLKEQLNSEDYGVYSLLITYISLLSSFGMLGFEQTLLRNSVIKLKLEIDKALIVPIIFSALLVSLIGSFLMFNNYNLGLDISLIFLLSLMVILVKLIYNLYRLSSRFVTSQIALNFWKIALFFVVLFFFFFDYSLSLRDVFLSIIVFFFLSLFLFFGLINKVLFISNLDFQQVLKQSALFMLTLFTISLISFGDRFFIESRFGLIVLGDYFFYINMFLFPFSLFQTYIGFKEIVSFKKDFQITVLNSKLLFILKNAIYFSLFLFTTLYLVDYWNLYNFNISSNLNIIIPLIFLGIIKIAYSLLSAAMGAICSDDMLFEVNVKSILSILVVMPLIYYFSFNISITLIFIIALWLIRCFIWYNQLQKNEN